MIRFRCRPAVAGAAVMVAMALPAVTLAQAISAPNMDELRRQGYVLMDDISTPLLHHVATGQPYDLRTLAHGDGSSGLMRVEHPARRDARSDDEFQRAAVAPAWGAFIDERVRELREARGYLVQLGHTWGEYDFSHQRFPVRLRMNKHAWRGGTSHHCGGAYGRAGRSEYRTACLVSAELNKFVAPLSVFPLADVELARQIKQGKVPVAIFAVAEPAGPYKLLKGNELRYMPDLSITAASGVQPVLITDLLLVEARAEAGPILAVYHVADSRRRPAPAPNAPAATAADARWQPLGRDPAAATFADTRAARRNGAVVVAPMLVDFNKPMPGGLRSTVGLYTFDCAQRRVRQLDLKGFAEPMGKGGLLEQDASPRELPLAKGSNLELMLNHACNLDTGDSLGGEKS